MRRLVLLAVLTGLSAMPATGQGCSQCREAIGQTPARTQAAYRRAILVLVGAGATIFTGVVVALRRFR
jgi:hypothetical protein